MNVDLARPAFAAAEATETLDAQIAAAARAVPALWPLDGAIAVNPLAAFEDHRFETAIRAGARQYGARAALPLDLWRRLAKKGQPPFDAVRDAAIDRLGGLDAAFHSLGPDITPFDCLMARLFDMPPPPPAPAPADPAAMLVARWCAAFFDRGTAVLKLPGSSRGLFAAVLELLAHEPSFAARPDLLGQAPRAALPAIAWALDRLGVPPGDRMAALTARVARLPGWAGHINWREAHAGREQTAAAPASMADLIALLLLCDLALGAPAPARPAARDAAAATRAAIARHFGFSPTLGASALDDIAAMDDTDLGLIFQHAAERAYRDDLIARIARQPNRAADAASPAAQLVFCIDVRSEPLRRAVEAAGAYETFGYAGFFGLPIALRLPDGERRPQLPALATPQHDLELAAAPGADAAARRSLAAGRAGAQANARFGELKSGLGTSFATAEAAGPLGGALMIANTLAPRAMRRLRRAWHGDPTHLAPAIAPHGTCAGLPFEARLASARALFDLTGLPAAGAAPLVVLVGHAAEASNNPYRTTLDCGACGGHGGGANARTLAAILNDEAVRTSLAAEGKPIPEGTWFLAAEHNTTAETVTLFDTAAAPASHAAAIDALARDLARAAAASRAARAASPGRATDDPDTAAAHWADVRPEWGLTGNAAFIIGPRAMTRDADLGGRAFLHSYDWESDDSGAALAAILAAPMVVAQWINCQYLFSTVDNDRLGAGDKTLHNPVGRLGVVLGNGGDLRTGLPRQSLFHDDGTPAHVPQRLLVVIHAPAARVEAAVAGNATVRRLFAHRWVLPVIIDPHTGACHAWRDPAPIRPAA